MAIVPIRNLGGGGGSDTSTKYIVKDGIVKVAFDDTVYRRLSAYSVVSTQWAYDTSKLLYHTLLSANATSAGYATSNAINLTKYNTLTVVGKVLQTNSLVTKTLDISNINSGYIVIDMARDSYSTTYLNVIVSSAKADYVTNKISQADVEYTTNTTTSNYAQIVDIKLS